MVRKRFALGTALVALLVLLWATGGVVAGPPSEGPEGEAGAQGDVGIAAYISPVMSYQGRLVENGSPADGTRSMTFRLWTASMGGTKEWEEGPKSVDVTNGLFHVTLGDTTPMDVNDFDQALWLEVEVEGITLPRQELLGAPYAYSLVPGADVSGDIGAGWSVLHVYNAGSGYGVLGRSSSGHGVFGRSTSGHGVYAESNGSGLNGAALKAESKNTTNGIAIWAKNDSGDTTLALSNNGAGNLIKGFGGDGGEDEFRVSNDGKIETKADSYLWVPAHLAVAAQYSVGDITITPQPNGAVKVKKNTGSGTEGVFIPIAIPGVLYGQNVDVELVRIYYKCSSANSYISQTWLNKQTGASTQVVIINDPTDYKSTTDSSYSLTPSPSGLSSSEGSLNLHLGLHFANNTDTILIGGVRLRLGHHHLY